MALTSVQLAYLRSKIGTSDPPSDSDLEANYIRLDYSLDAVAREILETRLADLANQPDTFTVVGDYSQSTGKQMAAISGILASLGGEQTDLGGATLVIVDPSDPLTR